MPGGNLTGTNREASLRTLGRLANADEFGNVVVASPNGNPIRVKDVARVEDGRAEQRSVARLNGVPSVSLEIRRQSGANSIEVIEAVKANLDRVRGVLPPGVKMEIIRDQSSYIYAALHEINLHLILGSVLACLVVFAFTRSWRSVVIAGVAIPASVVSTFAVMWLLNFTLNSVTMLALVLMVGIVIDDAIVVLENIFRYVEEKKMPPMQAAYEGTKEIALAVLATTLSLAVIFVPVSFMSSITGRFLYQFGITAGGGGDGVVAGELRAHADAERPHARRGEAFEAWQPQRLLRPDRSHLRVAADLDDALPLRRCGDRRVGHR